MTAVLSRPAPAPPGRVRGRHRAAVTTATGATLLVAVGVTATCLRSPVTAVGAELDGIRTDLGLGPLATGALTALPLAVFAAAGALAPAATRRIGVRGVVLGGLAVVAVGVVARAAAGSATVFLAATVVVLVAVAGVNVVLPPAVGPRSPWATGVFSVGVLTGIAAPAAAAVPLGAATGLDWRGGVGVWAVPAVLALTAWRPAAVSLPTALPRRTAGAATAHPDPPTHPVRRPRRPVALAGFFGAQSLGAFAVMGWLPQIYRDAGLSSASASALLAVTVVLALPVALLVPGAVRRGGAATAGRCVVAIGVAQVTGLGGLALAPAGPAPVWALLLTAAHAGFPLAMALVDATAAARPGDAGEATRLSAVVQSGGYALAVAGPLLVGPLRAGSGDWSVPIGLLAAVAVAQLAAGLRVTTTLPAPPTDEQDTSRDRDPRPPRRPALAAAGARHRRAGPPARRPPGSGGAAQQRRDDAAAGGDRRRGDRDAR